MGLTAHGSAEHRKTDGILFQVSPPSFAWLIKHFEGQPSDHALDADCRLHIGRSIQLMKLIVST